MSWAPASAPAVTGYSGGCWAPELPAFFAVALGATGGTIAKSAAGATFTDVSGGPLCADNAFPIGAEWLPGLGRVIVVGEVTPVDVPEGAWQYSDDAAGTWTAGGSPFTGDHSGGSGTSILCVANNPTTGRTVMAAAYYDENIATSGDGETFTAVSSPFDGAAVVTTLRFLPSGRLIAAGNAAGGTAIYAYSDDGGDTWTQIADANLPGIYPAFVRYDEDTSTVWTGGNFENGPILSRSADDGETWTQVPTSYDATIDDPTGFNAVDMLIYGGLLTVCGSDYEDPPHNLIVSADDGATWHRPPNSTAMFGRSGVVSYFVLSPDLALLMG